jgi:hypothetical protein
VVGVGAWAAKAAIKAITVFSVTGVGVAFEEEGADVTSGGSGNKDRIGSMVVNRGLAAVKDSRKLCTRRQSNFNIESNFSRD